MSLRHPYISHHAVARELARAFPHILRPEHVDLRMTADAAWRAHLDGLALLTQRRRPDDGFDYLATRT